MNFREIEFKYSAENIKLQDFHNFCTSGDPKKFKYVSGYDHFYENKKDNGAFCRHRVGEDSNQLTFKRKTEDKNNFIRSEHNIDLSYKTTEPKIKALLSEFGYEFKTSLFKSCFIYSYDFYILVYYVVCDSNMQELGRFIEIEMREDYAWKSDKEAFDSLVAMERICKPLGISPQARVKKSLFELFS